MVNTWFQIGNCNQNSIKVEQNVNGKNETEKLWWYEVYSILSVCSVCISCGMFLGYTSSGVPSMEKDESLDTLHHHYIALIGGLGPLGALFGALLSMLSLKFFGPRRTIGLLGVPALIASWLTIGFSRSFLQIMIGRFLGGVGVGATIASAPLYVMDVATTSRRGKMGIMPQFLMISGILIVYILGGLLNWSSLALVSTVFSLLGGFLLIFAPDSPKWNISRGKYKAALTTLNRLQGHQNAELLCKELQENLKQSMHKLEDGQNSFWTMSKIKPILVCLGIVSIQQLTGINGITFFAASIFSHSSPSVTTTSHIFSIILASTQLIASFISSFFVERFGRTFLLKISTFTITLSTTFLGFYFYFLDSISPDFFWVPLLTLIIYACGFGLGLGPVSWILVAELLPQDIRQLVNPVIIAYNWFCVCIITTSFPWLKNSIDFYGIFWLYAIISAVGFVFVVIFVPETKGKVLK